MHVGHEVLAVFVEVGLKGDGAARYVGVGLHQHPAVGEHRLGIVKLGQHVEVDVTRGLLHAQQHVVDMLYGAVERLRGLLYRLLLDGLSGMIEHD